MERAENVRNKAEELVRAGRRPSALRIARELGFTEEDVHRCLNVLERDGAVETYTREVLGTRYRMVGVSRG